MGVGCDAPSCMHPWEDVARRHPRAQNGAGWSGSWWWRKGWREEGRKEERERKRGKGGKERDEFGSGNKKEDVEGASAE